MSEVILETNLDEIPLFFKGKVRDVYDLDDKLLIVATDRISAFDVVLPTGIPDKGRVLTDLSVFWFRKTSRIVKNHLITSNISQFPKQLLKFKKTLKGRSVLVKKAKVIPLECVVRGYLSGSGWEEYKQKESICGIRLPPDMEESDKLLEPIFTPATKAKSGHDLNITQKEAADLVGEKLFAELKEKSLKIYQEASNYAEERGLIIADTKFEFGIYKGKVILVDEVLTPDSSRFWAGDEYSPGGPQKSFDKQFVRDYLMSLNWNKEPPAPVLPERIVEKTREKYLEAARRVMGKGWIGD